MSDQQPTTLGSPVATSSNVSSSRSRDLDGRIANLDGLRGLAAMSVVLFHYSTRFDQLFGHAQPLGWAVPMGGFGVDLFFILSGFVILLTLERTKSIRQFITARFCRLYPVFWCGVIVTFTVVATFGLSGQEVGWTDCLLNFTMIQEVFDAKSVDGAYWSLQAELFFYMNALVLYFSGAFRRCTVTVLGWLSVSAIVGLIVSYSDVAILVSGLNKLQTILSLEYIPLFGIGICLHELYRQRCSGRTIMALIIACLAVQWLRVDSYKAIVDLAMAGIVATAISRPIPGLASRPLLFLGAVSYPLYIVHQNIGYVIIRSLEESALAGNIAVGLAIGAALGLAFLITKYIDRPTQQHLRPLLKQITFDSISTWNVRSRTAVLTSTDHQSLQSNALNRAGNRES